MKKNNDNDIMTTATAALEAENDTYG